MKRSSVHMQCGAAQCSGTVVKLTYQNVHFLKQIVGKKQIVCHSNTMRFHRVTLRVVEIA